MKVVKMKHGFYAVRKLSLFGWVYLDIATSSYFTKISPNTKHVVLSTKEEAELSKIKYEKRLELAGDLAYYRELKRMENEEWY